MNISGIVGKLNDIGSNVYSSARLYKNTLKYTLSQTPKDAFTGTSKEAFKAASELSKKHSNNFVNKYGQKIIDKAKADFASSPKIRNKTFLAMGLVAAGVAIVSVGIGKGISKLINKVTNKDEK